MSDDSPRQVTIVNNAPNYGPQGVFNASVNMEGQAQPLVNRLQMLANVKSNWMPWLDAIPDETRISVSLYAAPDAVYTRLDEQYQELRAQRREIPSGTNIQDIFIQAGRSLLILGGPGSGKTILLIELLRDLITTAEYAISAPIPVVLNLSSWAQKRLRLEQWLCDELRARYDVNRKIARAWVASNALLLLLDGLDEVRPHYRTACVEAINAFRDEHGMVPLAVCSRRADYEALAAKLRLQQAVVVQPLSPEQVENFLASGQGRLSGLREALRRNPALAQMATTPLLLSIMSRVYTQQSPATAPAALTERELFEAYVQQMFSRRDAALPYSLEQTRRWLGWLARRLVQHDEPQFMIERMQPSWLQDTLWVHALLVAAVIGLIFWFLPRGLAFGGIGAQGWDSYIIGGLILGGIAAWRATANVQTVEILRWSWRQALSWLLGALVLLPILLFFGSLKEVVEVNADQGWLYGLAGGVLLTSLALALKRLRIRRRVAGTPDEATTSSNADLVWRYGCGGGFIIWIGVSFIIGMAHSIQAGMISKLPMLLLGSMLYVLFLCVLIGLAGGLRYDRIAEHSRVNEGIWRSFRHALLMGIVAPLVLWAIIFAFNKPLFVRDIFSSVPDTYVQWLASPSSDRVDIFITFLLIGAAVALPLGGFAVLKHSVLRLVLALQGHIPWRYVRFLEFATERIILYRVGGGYWFMHRTLMDYFASATPPDRHSQLYERIVASGRLRYGSWKRFGLRMIGFAFGFGLASGLFVSLGGAVIVSVTSDPPIWAIVGLAAWVIIGMLSILMRWGAGGWIGGLCVAIFIAAAGAQSQQPPAYPTGPAILIGMVVGALFALLKPSPPQD